MSKRVLNLYCGLGGNRQKWTDCEVVAVEGNEKIAALYQKLNPDDEVILGDAHEFLRQNHSDYDYIWSSPPCQSHSRIVKATRHSLQRYPDLRLYEEIIFLQNFSKAAWVVENVMPYYKPLITPTSVIGRHLFWASYPFEVMDAPSPPNFINRTDMAGKKALQDWLGIHFDENIYYEGNHCPAQVLRNCVHPDIGLDIYNANPAGS